MKLERLRAQLGRLRRQRWSVRWASGWSLFATVLIWLLVGAFVVDFWLRLRVLERLAVLLVLVLAGLWTFRRSTWPLIRVRENDLQVALLVEKQQKLDSDLVTALQFEQAPAAGWGSTQLRDAVVEYVADFSKGINVFEGISYAQVKRRLMFGGATLLVAVLAMLMFPGYAAAFFNRLMLGRAHYPTRTVISTIAVNGQTVGPGSGVALPAGVPVEFVIDLRGEIPSTGEVQLASRTSAQVSRLQLLPDRVIAGNEEIQTSSKSEAEKDAAEAKARGVPTSAVEGRRFRVGLPRLNEPVDVTITAGDAFTDPFGLEQVPRPVVDVQLRPTPPAYASRSKKASESAGSRQLAVIEGSQVDVTVHCSNKKLKSVLLLRGEQSLPLVPMATGEGWQLPPQTVPFDQVTEPIAFEIQVVDEDGITLERPLPCYIRILADRAPRIVAAVVTDRVLPGAKPNIAFGATDDYGVSAVTVKWQLTRADGEQLEGTVPVIKTAADSKLPPAVRKGKYAFDLKPLKLNKGDEVRVSLEATDYRGTAAGKTAASEPVVLQVTDESGILAGLSESDEKSAQQLDLIIQRQLGIGGSQ